MFDRGRRVVLATVAGAAVLGLMAETAFAQTVSRPSRPSRSSPTWPGTLPATRQPSKSITKPDAEIHNYQPTPADILKAQEANLVLWNGLNLELWFEKFFQRLKGVPGVVVSQGVKPMGIAEGPYNGKPNPHAWMSPNAALIYVENIRNAFAKYDPKNADDLQGKCRGVQAEDQAVD